MGIFCLSRCDRLAIDVCDRLLSKVEPDNLLLRDALGELKEALLSGLTNPEDGKARYPPPVGAVIGAAWHQLASRHQQLRAQTIDSRVVKARGYRRFCQLTMITAEKYGWIVAGEISGA